MFTVAVLAAFSAALSGVAPPSDLVAVAISQSQINLSWTDNSADETLFKVERSPDGSTDWQQIGTPSANVNTFSNIGLACGTIYFYRVCAYNPSGCSDYSNVAYATTLPCLPAAPTNLNAAPVSLTQIDLSWTDNSSNEGGFEIERSPDGSTGWSLITTTSIDTTSFQDTGLNCGTPYSYRVRAVITGGSSGYSNIASAATPVCLPDAPGGLSLNMASATQADLAWIDLSSTEAGFRVQRASAGGADWADLAEVGANLTTYCDTTLLADRAYSYRVYAYNASGVSPFSNVVSTRFWVYLPFLLK